MKVAPLVVLGGAAVAAVWFGALPPRREGGDAASPAATARAPVAGSAREIRVPAPDVAREAPEVHVPATESARGKSARDEAVSWLRAVDPDRYGELAPEQAAQLTALDLEGRPVSDADLEHLATFPLLRSLGLRGTSITDAGLVHLQGLALEHLELRATSVTGAELWRLPWRLESLHLTDTQVTTTDLYGLPALPNLRVLKLNFLELGDTAVGPLSAYRSLTHVELDRSGLSDDGLRRLLESSPFLARVEIRDTQVTRAGVETLQQVYPGCEFVLDQGSGRSALSRFGYR